MAELSIENNRSGNTRSRSTNGRASLPVFSGLGKLPPRALEAEQAVLGALMLEKDAIPGIIDLLRPEAFYEPAHAAIYEAILLLYSDSSPVDLVTVKNRLQQMGQLEKAGGPLYIVELTAKVASAAHVEFHARIIIEKFIQRELIRVADRVVKDAFEDTTDVFELLDSTERDIFQLSQSNLRRNFQDMPTLILQTIKRLEELEKKDAGVSGVPSGFPALDQYTSGWQPSDLIIIAARPSMGKTAFILSTARNSAMLYHKPVAIFSLEMAAQQLVQRLICSEAEIDAQKLRTGKLTSSEWVIMNSRIKDLNNAPIYIDDTPALSIMDLRAKSRKLKSEKKIELIIIDYLQLMTAGQGVKAGNREQEIAAISRALKELAKELMVPVIALSQLSRQVENRPAKDKKPMLSDLRESGSIEQDADMVMFLYRPEYYKIETDDNGNSTHGLGQVIIAKQRNGPTGEVDLRFIKEYAKFIPLEENYYATHNSETPKSFSPSDRFNSGENSVTFPSKMNNMDLDEFEGDMKDVPF
jgi:replicative DNA helicase